MKKMMLACLFFVSGTMALAQTQNDSTAKKKLTTEERTEKYVAKMQQQLNLDETQKQKVYDLRLEKVTKIKEIRKANQGDKEAIKTAAKPVVKEYNTELKTILTEVQLEKWKTFRQAERTRMKAAAEKRKGSKNNKMKENPLEDDDYMDSIDEE